MTAALLLAVLVVAGLAVLVVADRRPQEGRHSARGRSRRLHPSARRRATPKE